MVAEVPIVIHRVDAKMTANDQRSPRGRRNPSAVFMVLEARKHGIKFVWVYIAGGFLVAVSVTFPLFLLARELRLAKTDPVRRISGVDAILLTVVASVLAGVTVWVDAV
jgi:hypothetical protein